MKVQFLSSVVALAMLASTAAHAVGVKAVDVKDISRSAMGREFILDAKGQKIPLLDKDGKVVLDKDGKEVMQTQNDVDFLRASEVKASVERVNSIKNEIFTSQGLLKEIVDLNAVKGIFKLGQKGQVTDATDLVTLLKLKNDREALTKLQEMIVRGERDGLIRTMARYMAVRKNGAITPDKLIENNKAYIAADTKEGNGQFTRYKNHLELIRNMSLELYKNPEISEQRALELSIMRLKQGKGERPTRQEVAALAEKLLRENCI